MHNFSQILFVMWRETVEAMLVVGILHAWLAHNPGGERGLKYLWLGVLTGLVGAFLLGLGIDALNSVLSDEGQEYFQAALLLVAAALIVQMVFWMRRQGARMQQGLVQSLARSTQVPTGPVRSPVALVMPGTSTGSIAQRRVSPVSRARRSASPAATRPQSLKPAGSTPSAPWLPRPQQATVPSLRRAHT